MAKVRHAILSTRELFVSFAAMREDMMAHVGASGPGDDQADWVSHQAVQIAGGDHEAADDMEAMFHLLVIDRPDASIIASMIRRAVAEQPVSGRLPTRKDINGILKFARQRIPVHTLLATAAGKTDDEWLRARSQWLHVLRAARRLSGSLGIDRADFRAVGYQVTIGMAPLIFLVLLLWDDPRKRRWLMILHQASRQFKAWVDEEPEDADLIRAFILRRVEHMAATSKLGRRKPRFPKPPKSV
ncbi:MAG: hypothetical protein M0Z36_00650 [Thermaerobacter sp.]|nr:hypothetical protein [Thermaerobacter sp.]